MHTKGKYGEQLAYEYLQRQGLRLVARNYRNFRGEIDLIMDDQGIIVFVEVKYRTSERFGNPLEAVDFKKQKRIKSIAYIYLANLGYEPQCRFDVVAILGKKIQWVKGAFS